MTDRIDIAECRTKLEELDAQIDQSITTLGKMIVARSTYRAMLAELVERTASQFEVPSTPATLFCAKCRKTEGDGVLGTFTKPTRSGLVWHEGCAADIAWEQYRDEIPE